MAEENLSCPLSMAELTVANKTIVELHDWCTQRNEKPYPDAVLSVAIAINCYLLSGPANQIRSSIFKRESLPEWNEWLKAERGCVEKWADRDNQGEIKRDGKGLPVVNENAVEFNKEIEELAHSEQFKTMWDTIDAKEEENRKIEQSASVVKVCCLDAFDHAPRDMVPRLLSVLMGKTVMKIMKEA